MYYVEQRYQKLEEDSLFARYDEALESAHKSASKDYEGYDFIVNEIKAVVKGERPKLAVKTLEVTDEITKAIICQKDGDEDTVSIPNL